MKRYKVYNPETRMGEAVRASSSRVAVRRLMSQRGLKGDIYLQPGEVDGEGVMEKALVILADNQGSYHLTVYSEEIAS